MRRETKNIEQVVISYNEIETFGFTQHAKLSSRYIIFQKESKMYICEIKNKEYYVLGIYNRIEK
jgi:alpha-D-ribose 1-methylphosphonate 5-triphosphate synthase subunit PhnI